MLYLNVSFYSMRKSIHYIFFLRRFKMKKDSLMSFCLLSKYLGTRLCSFLLTSHWACPLSTLIQENLKLSLMVAAAWRDVAQLKGEGAAFVESKVCSLIFQFGRKCSFMNVFMCAFYVNCKLLVRCSPWSLIASSSANNYPWLGTWECWLVMHIACFL